MNPHDEAEYRLWDLRRDVRWLASNLDRLIDDLDADELHEIATDLRIAARRAEALKRTVQ